MYQAKRITNDDLLITTQLTITSAHVSPGQTIDLTALSSLIQDVRLEHLYSHGIQEHNLQDNIGYMVTKNDIEILRPAYHLDELVIQIYSPGFRQGARGFRLNYQITRQSDRATIAEGSSTQLFYDFSERRLARAPDHFHAIMHANLSLFQLPLGASAAA